MQLVNFMRRILVHLLFFVSIGISSCSTGTVPATPEVVSVYSTSAAEPWLPALYECAGSSSVLNRVDDSSVAEIILRVGEPKFPSSHAYQIDTEEILIVTHRQSPVQNLTLEDARALFAGQGDPSVQVLVYAPGVDVQDVFDQFVMEGRPVTSSALIAPTAQQMSDTLNDQMNTVGIVPGHWKMGDSRFVYSIPDIPVLALTQSEPAGAIRDLLTCLQK